VAEHGRSRPKPSSLRVSAQNREVRFWHATMPLNFGRGRYIQGSQRSFSLRGVFQSEIVVQSILCLTYLNTPSLLTESGQPQVPGNDTTPGNATIPAIPAPVPHQPPVLDSYPILYAFLSLLAILPRLWLGAAATAAYGGNMLSTRSRGMLTGVVYQAAKSVFPTWLQWAIHYLSPGAPGPMSVAGVEWVLISLFAFFLGFHPAVAFGTYHYADAFLHPLVRRLQGACEESELLVAQRHSLFWFGRLYFLVGIFAKAFPELFSDAVVRLLWFSSIALLAWWVFAFIIHPLSLPAESKAPYTPYSCWSPRFRYTPLYGRTTFRLLRINPSLTNSIHVKCSLLQVPLDGDSLDAPQYIAISHKWPDFNGPNQTTQHLPSDEGQERDGLVEDVERNAGALSGTTAASANILVNGCRFPVHPDILLKLRDVRSAFRPVCVWLDNICINQQDDDERAQQVTLMSQIYAKANHVVACLVGLENVSYGWVHHLRRLVYLRLTPEELEINKLDTMLYRLRDSRLLQDFSARDDPAVLLSMIGDDGHWDALHRFLSNRWFRRVWMLQEVTMARRIELRYCGEDLDWDTLAYAMAALHRSGLRDFQKLRQLARGDDSGPEPLSTAGIDGAMIYDNLRRWRQEGNLLSLMDTLILCLRFQSGEDVDRIFAMLGVISDWDRRALKIQPEYGPGKEIMVFQKTAWRLLFTCSVHDQFRLLRFAGIGRSRRLNLPSWVPDWTAGLQEFVLEHRNPAANFGASRKQPRRFGFAPTQVGAVPNALQLEGILVDEIVLLADLSETPPIDSPVFPVQAALSKALDYPTTRYPFFEDAFWRTLITDSDPVRRPAHPRAVEIYKRTKDYGGWQARRHLSREEERQRRTRYWAHATARTEDRMFSHLLATDLSKRLPDRGGDICSLFSSSLNASDMQTIDMSAGRQLCITKTGYMGLVPRFSREGDVVVVFHGAQTPHVLRRASTGAPGESDGAYLLVGECYLHHAMDGQAVGPESVFTIV